MKTSITSELTGTALDWAVAKCERKNGILHDDGITRCIVVASASGVYKGTFRPSFNWGQGGPIMERERISVWPFDDVTWRADDPEEALLEPTVGPTPLIAAMRCYVASKMGDRIEIPEELAPSASNSINHYFTGLAGGDDENQNQ